MVLLQRKLYFSKDPEGVQHFPGGGGPTFSRGKMHITYPPLDPHMAMLGVIDICAYAMSND